MSSYITGDIFVSAPPKQTLKAWGPFWDCVDILFEFQNSDADEEHTEWRLLWVAGIALLRTIGHVLAKVDGAASSAHKQAVDHAWARWKADTTANAIFWDFIEKERNNLLKTYEFGAKISKGDNGYFVEFSGGEDAFQLFREAVYWWRHQLITIEDQL
ncbi:hypothetical protein ACJ41P_29350 [Azospirillum argentinense]|uniref:Uncharacterized protein n=1 Tax=Azospirillum argentinense TaxID=2970906 RepID=A0ABW8VGX9_9PROT